MIPPHCPHVCPSVLHTPHVHLGTSFPLLCLAAPSSQMLPGFYNFCPADQPSWRHWGAGGGEGAPAGVLGGTDLPSPCPPSSPHRTSLMPHPPVPAVLVTQQEIPAPGQGWPPLPKLSPQPLAGAISVWGFVGWVGSGRTLIMRWTKDTAVGWLLGDGPRLTWHRAGGSTQQWPLPPLQRVPAVCVACVRGCAHSTTWGWVWPGSAAQSRGAGCSSGPALPSPPSHHLSSSPSTRWRLRSRLLSAVPKLFREGEEGQYKAKGPAPLTRHRDKSDLFILVKKSNKDNFALHLAWPIKTEFLKKKKKRTVFWIYKQKFIVLDFLIFPFKTENVKLFFFKAMSFSLVFMWILKYCISKIGMGRNNLSIVLWMYYIMKSKG